MTTIEATVCFSRGPRTEIRLTDAPASTVGRVPLISRLMALAIHYEDLLRLGISAIKEFDPVQGRSSRVKDEWLQGLLLPQIADLSEKSICCAPRR